MADEKLHRHTANDVKAKAQNADLADVSDTEVEPGRKARQPQRAASVGADGLRSVSVQRVRRAYEQVYDQLRELIMSGELARGERLPREEVLARDFAVSRGTVREALRLLAAQSLVRTVKGAGGGSFVTLPAVDHVSEALRLHISLLSESEDVSLEEFLEARELLEVFAATLAAERKGPTDIAALRATIHDDPLSLTDEERFVMNKDFHNGVVTASRNALLKISAQPIYSILQTNLDRTTVAESFNVEVFAHHREILQAIEIGDAELTRQLMQKHLLYLRGEYQRGWRRSPVPTRAGD